MEIQNKKEQNTPELTEDSLQDTSAKQEEAEIQEETESQEEQNPSSNRRFLLWTLAGIYLLYTGYSLCKNVIQGAEGASTGFLLAGIAFAVVGAGLLFFSAKSMLAEDKLKKAKAAKEAGMRAAVGGELGETSQGKSAPSGEKKSMSIAERANLTKRLEEEEAETETDSEENPESETEK